MESRLLALLGTRWVTPIVALREVGCLSLSQRCGEFRRELGLPIADKWVKRKGKRFKAYRLAA